MKAGSDSSLGVDDRRQGGRRAGQARDRGGAEHDVAGTAGERPVDGQRELGLVAAIAGWLYAWSVRVSGLDELPPSGLRITEGVKPGRASP